MPNRIHVAALTVFTVGAVLALGSVGSDGSATQAWAQSADTPSTDSATQNATDTAQAPLTLPEGVSRGQYVFQLAGCKGCHTDKKNEGPELAGGRAFKTDFGTFYSPNITPDETGIGDWTFEDFRTAMREGVAPDGSNYFPAFPYTTYTHMTDADLRDLWDYLSARPAIQRENTPHDLKPLVGWRWMVTFWKWLYFDQGPRADWSRGRYVTEAMGHCQECHTPRNFLGGLKTDLAYAGTNSHPEGLEVPNITPHEETGIGKWSDGDLRMFFTIGMFPDADFVSGVMAESVSNSTSKMTEADRQAMMDYLAGLKPVENRIGKEKGDDSATPSWQ